MKEVKIISEGFALFAKRIKSVRKTKVYVFPVPGPAMIKVGPSVSKIAFCFSESSFKLNFLINNPNRLIVLLYTF